jgi:transcription elongation factor Elf1
VNITIDCPVCNSRNTFVTKTTNGLSCEDCGFRLADNSSPPTGECIFCGSTSFYYSSPLVLRFMKRDSVCYVCGARYRKTRIDNPEPCYSEKSFGQAQQSREAARFRERAHGWH